MYCQGKSFQFLLFCAGCFSCLQSGFHLGWSSYALPQMFNKNSTIHLTNDEGFWVASMFLIGSVFGSTVCGLVVDVIGRKTVLVMISFPVCGCWLAIAYARYAWELHLARFILGFTDGAFYSCFPMYLAEICDANIRGLLISVTTGVYILGLLMANVMGEFLDMFVVAIIWGVLSLGTIFYLLVPESPYFHMSKGNFDKARDSLEKFVEHKDVENVLASLKNSLKEQDTKRGTWLELFTDSSNRKCLYLVVLSRVFQQFTGFIGIIMYAQTVFEEFKEVVKPVISVSCYYILQGTVLIITALIVDKVGRKVLLVASITTVFLSLSVVSTYFILENMFEMNVSDYSWFPILGLFMYVIGFTFGLQNVPFILISELFPLHVKTYANALFSVLYGVTAATSTKFLQYTKDEYGMHVPFIVFTIVGMIGIPYYIICVPETKKKTLEEIQAQLKSKQKR
ncbi:hypothetical protein FQR65_LT01942 [Abscondita terminalis]|nr:hypothetical protein FQR65_LT01942 [Abscondita terminalis]